MHSVKRELAKFFTGLKITLAKLEQKFWELLLLVIALWKKNITFETVAFAHGNFDIFS